MAQNKIKLRQITQDSAVTNGTIRFDGTNWAANNNLRTTSGGQLILPSYTSSSSFVGTAEGLLGFDENGNIITVVTGDTFLDDVFRIQDGTDATKQIAFEASGITSGTTRTFTVPNASGTLALGTGAATQFARWNTANTLEGISSDRITIDASNKLIVGSNSTQRALSKAPWNWTVPGTVISSNNTSAWDCQLAVAYNGAQLFQRQVNPIAGAGTLWNSYMTYESSEGTVRSPLTGDFPMDMRVRITRGVNSPYDPYDDGSAVSPMRVVVTAVDGTTKQVSTSTEFRTRLSSDGSNAFGGGNLVMTLQPNLDVTLHGYPNSRDDAGTPTNFLSTDASGNLISNPTSILAGGITTLNTLTASSQTFATGTSGSDFNISSSSSTHTFNIPDAASSARGLVSTSAQSFSGTKNFNALLTAVSGIDLGVDNTTRGTIRLHSTNTGSVTIQPSNSTTTDYTLTLPTTDGDSGQVLSTDGSGVLSWVSAGSGTPAGSDTEIQYNNAGAFGASANFKWVNASTKLNIGSPASGTGRIVIKGSDTGSSNYILQGYNSSDVEKSRITNSGYYQGTGASLLAFDLSTFYKIPARIQQPFDSVFTDTSGTLDLYHQYSNFAPTSGTAVFNGFYMDAVINQTGGANGITRGVYINPTITAAADFRALETSRGKVIFGGTDAVQIPVGTTAQRPTGVQGMIRRNTSTSAWEGFDGSTWGALATGTLTDGDKGDITVGGGTTTLTIDNLAVTNAKINDVSVAKLTSGTLTGAIDFRVSAASNMGISYTNTNTGLLISNSTNAATLGSQDATQYFSADNTASYIGSGGTYMQYIDGVLRLYDSDATHYVGIQTPATGTLTTSYTLTLPADDGTSGQVLSTNGAGTLSWATPSSGGETEITPTELSADQNDYDPSGLSTATLVRISGDANFREITGLAGGAASRKITFRNVGSYPIGFLPEHTGSTAANRFSFSLPFLLYPKESVEFYYDNTASRWTLSKFGALSTRNRVNIYTMGGESTTAGDQAHYINSTSGGSWGAATISSTIPSPAWAAGTSTSTTGSCILLFPKNPAFAGGWFGAGWILYTNVVSLATLSDGTNRYSAGIKIGSASTTTTTGNSVNSFVGIRYTDNVNSGNWQCYSRNSSGTETTLDSGVAASTSLVTLTIQVNYLGTKTRFYINDAYIGEITTNLPSALAWGGNLNILKSIGSTARTFNWFSTKCEHHY